MTAEQRSVTAMVDRRLSRAGALELEIRMERDRMLEYAGMAQDCKADIRRLRASMRAKQSELDAIRRAVDAVTSDTDRVILTARYLYGHTWQQIADEMGYSDDRAARRRGRYALLRVSL